MGGRRRIFHYTFTPQTNRKPEAHPTRVPIRHHHFLSLPGVCLEDDRSAQAWVSRPPLLSRILFRLFVLFLRSLRSMLSGSLDPGHVEEAPGLPVAMKAQEANITDVLFLIGPSPSENENRPAILTNLIPSSECGRLFLLNRLLSRSLYIRGKRGNNTKSNI